MRNTEDLQVGEDSLTAMAGHIRANPTITVRELAHAMGFAEEKSIYYWLRKAGYQGLRDFKRQVIGTSWPGASGADGAREGEGEYAYVQSTVTTSEYAPWILPGDALTVAPASTLNDGDLVVVDLPGEAQALRRFVSPDALIHPTRPRNVTRGKRDEWSLRGVVVRVVRDRP